MKREILKIACGGTAIFDLENEMGYRCLDCYAMLGSIGQPKRCQDLAQQYKDEELRGGIGWDYKLGRAKSV